MMKAIFVDQKSPSPVPPAAPTGRATAAPERPSVLTIGSLAAAAIALALCWHPVWSLVAIPVAGVGMILGLAALWTARRSSPRSRPVPVTAAALGSVALIVALFQSSNSGAMDVVILDRLIEGWGIRQETVPLDARSAEDAGDVSVERWADASTYAVQQADVRMRVVGLSLEATSGRQLHIRLLLENVSNDRLIDFRGWDGVAAAGGPRLVDDQGRSYHRTRSSAARDSAQWPQLRPNQTLPDVLSFDMPGDGVHPLKLDLPAAAFGGTGRLGFRLPRTMLLVGLAPALGAKALPGLRHMLNARRASLRAGAAAALGELGSAAVGLTDELAARLREDSDPGVRRAAAESLIKVGRPTGRAYAALLLAVGDADATVREVAATALDAMGAPGPAEARTLELAALDPRVAVRCRALDTLARHEANTALPALLPALEDPAVEVRLVAAHALARVGQEQRERVFPALAVRLREPDADVRRVVIAALRSLGPAEPEDARLLAQGLSSDGLDARTYAVECLSRLGPDAIEAVPALVARFADDDADLRRIAARAVAGVGHEALPELEKALHHAEPRIRATAALSVGQFGPRARDATPTLMALLADRSSAARAEASRALGRVGPDAKVALPSLAQAAKDVVPAARRAAVDAITAIGPEPFLAPVLAERLVDADPGVRGAALEALAGVAPTEECVPPLQTALAGTKPEVRTYAARALGQIGPAAAAAVPSLKLALQDDAAEVRDAAARALGRLAPAPGTLPALVQAVLGPDREIAETARTALEQIAKPDRDDVTLLANVLRSKDKTLQLFAATALVKLGVDARAAVPTLAGALSDRDEVIRARACEALGAVGPRASPAVPALLAALKDEATTVRRSAARALGEVVHVDAYLAVPALLAAMRDRDVREAAFDALLRVGTPAVPWLLEAVENSGEYRTRLDGIAVLAAYGARADEARSTLTVMATSHCYASFRKAARDALRRIEPGQPH
jgi:HEAT repeat protein